MWTTGILSLTAKLILAQTSTLPPNPSGVPFPNDYYPGFEDPATDAGAASGERSPPFYPSPWMTGTGDWAAAYTQAQAFVSQLTLVEKVNITTGVAWEGDRCVGNTGEIPRIGFRALCMQDSPVGIRFTDFNSVFPAGGTIAASWDRDLFYARGRKMGQEHYAKGIDAQLGPVVGPLGRAPEGGRNWEGFSPDPVLSGIAVAQTVKGIQSANVMAVTKHLIGNEQEHFRQVGESAQHGYDIAEAISSNIDDVTMHELYLWPFADAIRAGTASIMCSYQQVNNSYACANSYMMNKLVKDELGFQGFMMSDWGAQHSGIGSALAGLDMTMPGDTAFDSGYSYWGTNLTAAVLNGTIPEWRIDDMVTRIMAAWYYVGRNDSSPMTNFNSWTMDTYGYRRPIANAEYQLTNEHVNVQENHAAFIRKAAAQSTVLLKNTANALPLTGQERFTGVFGNDAGDNPLGPNGCPNRDCDSGTLGMAWGSGTAEFPFLISPLTAIQNQIVNQQTPRDVQFVLDNYQTSDIQSIAGQASVAIVFVNSDSGEGFIDIDNNWGDRKNLTLWQNGEALIDTVASLCNNTIVVIHSTGPIVVSSWYNNDNISAILWAGIPGEHSGNSIADVLYGRVNPSAKLPFTMGAQRSDYGTDLLYEPNNGNLAPQSDFVEGVFIDYRAFDKHNIAPIYEFGYGLSYTTFSYSDLTVTPQHPHAYRPTTGMTKAAPTLGTPGNASDYLYPAGFIQLSSIVYPFLNSTNLATATQDPFYGTTLNLPDGAQDGTPQPLNAAGGAPGGNPDLYDVLYTVTAQITNTGSVAGQEVAQVYVSLGGPNDPLRVLRGFEKLSIKPGGVATLKVQLTRRDLSNWDTVAQNWFVSSYPKTVYVGASSRKLYLNGSLS